MTGKEAKVYLSKQISMCEEKIELYENVKASKDFIELHKNLLDFYKAIEKDLEVLEILKNKNINICLIKDSYSLEDYNNTCIYLGGYSNQISKSIPITKEEYNLLKELLENEK